jgi:hypothetical protein
LALLVVVVFVFAVVLVVLVVAAVLVAAPVAAAAIGFAPGLSHLAKAPFGARQRWAAGAVFAGQAMNLPCASRQEAAFAEAVERSRAAPAVAAIQAG